MCVCVKTSNSLFQESLRYMQSKLQGSFLLCCNQYQEREQQSREIHTLRASAPQPALFLSRHFPHPVGCECLQPFPGASLQKAHPSLTSGSFRRNRRNLNLPPQKGEGTKIPGEVVWASVRYIFLLWSKEIQDRNSVLSNDTPGAGWNAEPLFPCLSLFPLSCFICSRLLKNLC